MDNSTKKDFQFILIKILKALSDQTRLNIVQDLILDETNTERHCSSFDCLKKFSRATRSHHFKVLREAGIISVIDKGNLSLAELKRAELEEAYPGLLAIIANES